MTSALTSEQIKTRPASFNSRTGVHLIGVNS